MLTGSKILIPDTGPLITLEMINNLNLLLLPEKEINIIDAVLKEVVFDENHPKSQTFLDFLVRDKSPFITHCETNVGAAMDMLDLKSLPRKNRKAVLNHAGENAIREWLIRNEKTISDYIVVTEDDGAVGLIEHGVKDLPQKPLVLSTSEFLYLLESHDLILSADEIITEIEEVSIKENKPRNI